MFKKVYTSYIEYTSSESTFWEHESGLKVLNFKNNLSREKTFLIGFTTLPYNSQGLPHMVEHCVLAGSQKYPLDDPFIDLEKKSGATYLNAWTSSVNTCYLSSSVLQSDFDKIFSLYLDAVFHPLLKKSSFYKEGVRPHFVKNKCTGFDGIVFNEMSADFLSRDTAIYLGLKNNFAFNTPYSYSSGGNPLEIIRADYKGFANFYKTFYTPQNCRIVFFGNVNIEEKLAEIEESISGLNSGKNYFNFRCDLKPTPPKKELTVDFAPVGSQGSSILLCFDTKTQTTATFDRYCWNLLSDILFGGSQSYLYKSIITSRIGKNCSDWSGLDSNLINNLFCIGIDDIDSKKYSKEVVEDFLINQLKAVSKIKFNSTDVNTAINLFEYSLKHIPSHIPLGIVVAQNTIKNWSDNYSDIIENIDLIKIFKKIKNEVKRDDMYFNKMLASLLKNDYSLLEVIPNKNKSKEFKNVIKKVAKEIKYSNQSDESLNNASLKPIQIESLNLDDLLEKSRNITLQTIADLNGGKILLFNQDTNGVVYCNIYFDLNDLIFDELKLLQLLSYLYDDLDTDKYKSEEIIKKIDEITPSYRFDPIINYNKNGCVNVCMKLSLSCLKENFNQSFSLLTEYVSTCKFSGQDKLKVALNKAISGYEEELVSDSSVFASIIAGKNLFLRDWVVDEIKGYSNYKYLIEVNKKIKNSDFCNSLIKSLETILHKISKSYTEVFVSGSKELCQIEEYISSRCKKNILTDMGWKKKVSNDIEFLNLPISTFSNTMCLKTNKDNPSLSVLSSLLSYGPLWESIRNISGSYSVKSSYNRILGLFEFTSSSDPECKKTFETFKKTVSYSISSEEVEDGIKKILSNEVKNYSPQRLANYAFDCYRKGVNQLERDSYLKRVADCKLSDVKIARDNLFEKSEYSLCSLGGKKPNE